MHPHTWWFRFADNAVVGEGMAVDSGQTSFVQTLAGLFVEWIPPLGDLAIVGSIVAAVAGCGLSWWLDVRRRRRKQNGAQPSSADAQSGDGNLN